MLQHRGPVLHHMEWYDKNTYIIAYHSRRVKGENNMSYQMVNEELKIKAYSLKGVTVSQTIQLRNRFVGKPLLEELAVRPYFFEEDGTLVLNHDIKYYDDYLYIAENMLQLDLETATKFANDSPKSLKSDIHTIRRCMEQRIALDECDLLGKNKYFFPTTQEMKVLGEIRHRKREYNQDWAMVDAFHYGFIQGKRYERARKAKRSERACGGDRECLM